MAQKILIVDDEESIVTLVEYNLRRAGYQTVTAATGGEALGKVRRHAPDLVILDVMLPDMEGYDVCRALRREVETPVLFLTARDAEWEKITGLELGGDDYLTKPFSPGELMARVRALLRRSGRGAATAAEAVRHGDVVIDLAGKEVRQGGLVVPLTPREFSLLEVLVTHPRRALSRDQLLDLAWGEEAAVDTRLVDVHISHLRQKLPALAGALRTVRGTGYKYVP